MKRAVANDKWVWTGLRRGLALRCPNCGEGRLLANYLKVRSPARSAMRPTPFTRPTTSRHTSRYSLPACVGTVIHLDGRGIRAATNVSVRRVRCRIEKVFGTSKRSYGLRRMRWIGLAKAGLQTRLAAIAYNIRRSFGFVCAAAT
jgi:hypothetical protein